MKYRIVSEYNEHLSGRILYLQQKGTGIVPFWFNVPNIVGETEEQIMEQLKEHLNLRQIDKEDKIIKEFEL